MVCVHMITTSTCNIYAQKKLHGRVGLAQLVRLLVVELTHSVLNLRFDMYLVFTVNYSFSER
jgi:hypothetical protein